MTARLTAGYRSPRGEEISSLQIIAQSSHDLLTLLPRPNSDSQAPLAPHFVPSEPHDDFISLGHKLVTSFRSSIIHLPVRADLSEKEIGVAGAEDLLDVREGEEGGVEVGVVGFESCDLRREEGETGWGEGAEREGCCWCGDVVGRFDVVEDLD